MNYEEAIEYIESTSKFGSNLGLARIESLLKYMGNPEKKLKCIHIAGTNGKGSVTSMIAKILMEAGYKVGIFTSPHLERFSERIKVNDDEISKEDIAKLTSYIKPMIEKVIKEGLEHPTEFEMVTAICFKYFEESKVDFAVIEVGLGGRLDSTNVIDPLLSVITTISYDHMQVLGDTLEKIAYEKAGIIKEGGIAVAYPQKKEALDVIKAVCKRKNAELIELDSSGITLRDYSINGQIFDIYLDGEAYEGLNTSLLGEHQLLNAKTAIAAVKALSKRGIIIDKKYIYAGIKNVRWPGRLEVMQKKPTMLLDGAHNIEGINSLKEALNRYFCYEKLILVMGVLKDKQVDEMCRVIMPMADEIITTTPESPRACPADKLGEIASNYCSLVYISKNINDAYDNAVSKAQKNDLILFCGSLYMIGKIRTIINEKKALLKS